MNTETKFGTIILIVILSFGIIGFNKKDLLHDWFLELISGKDSANQIGLFFISSIGDRTLRVQMIIQCKDRRQKRQLVKKRPVLVNQLINISKSQESIKHINNIDYSKLQSIFIHEVNKIAGSPIKDIFFERVFYN